jgi:tRNA nucleotidyltransferase (CCA-adding enzyme)
LQVCVSAGADVALARQFVSTTKVATPFLEAGSLLESRWPAELLAFLRKVSLAAGNSHVYLVGGAVRDLLLERPSYDIDLMVEDDGQALARRLAEVFGAQVHVHSPFGTATLTLPDGQRIDVATSRAERYERPGSLPDVTPAGLIHDLARRDFTVNALAMRVDHEAWGRVVDPFGGLADMRARKLSILHNLSFVEDPTRLVRGVRFERALAMRLDAATEAHARFAFGTGRIDGLGGERLKAELRKLFALQGLGASASRLAELDAWRLLHPDLAGRAVPVEAFDRLEWLLAEAEQARSGGGRGSGSGGGSVSGSGSGSGGSSGGGSGIGDRDRFRGTLAMVLAGLGVEAARDALAGLHLNAEDLHAILQCVEAHATHLPDAGRWTRGRPSELYRHLEGLGPNALRHLAASSGDPAVRRAVATHLRQRAIKLAVDGDWLISQGFRPGPVFGHILADTLAAVLDGAIVGPEAERDFALSRAEELLASR